MYYEDYIIPKWHHNTAKAFLKGQRSHFEISDAGSDICCVSVYDATQEEIAATTFFLLTNCNAYTM